MSNFFTYDNHPEHWKEILNDKNKFKFSLSWQRNDTLDSWRHNRMRAISIPLIKYFKNANWLTVGDGRYGNDGNFLKRNGAKKVHCSDISNELLKIAFKNNFIDDYSEQNAENLDFEDNSFDFIFCKEALHHCPRPYIALNEMFRVSKKGIIIIEPRDQYIDTTIFHQFYTFIKNSFKRSNLHTFEEVGNYQYRISKYEIEKFLLGMNYNLYGTFELTDYYEHGIENIKLNTSNYNEKKIIKRLKLKIKKGELYSRLKLRKSNIVGFILFKEPPDNLLIKNLERFGWKIIKLPKNPYKTNE